MSKTKTAPKKSVQKESSIPIKLEDGKFEETDKRTIHRYHLILKELGIPEEELKGASPEESSSVIIGVLREAKETRTEEQILLQKGDRVYLGEKSYELPPLTFKNSIRFRERCGVFAKNMFDFILTHAQTPDTEPTNGEMRYPILEIMTKESGINMHALLKEGLPYITGQGFEEIVELLFLCSPEIEADKELIMETASLAQLSHATLEVFRTALPFVVNLFQGMRISYDHAKTAGLPGIG